jgi:hypothetical protein
MAATLAPLLPLRLSGGGRRDRPRRGAGGCCAGVPTAMALLALLPATVRAEDVCPAPAQAMQAIEVMFGRAVDGRLVVTDRAWARFLAREVTPRFPDGLTVVDAAGQYKTPLGSIAQEPSKLLMIVAADGAQTESSIAAIVAAYKLQFRQHTVVVLTRAVCAAF